MDAFTHTSRQVWVQISVKLFHLTISTNFFYMLN